MNKKFLVTIAILIVFIVFLFTRFNNINQNRPDVDTFSWLYRINYYPWIVSANLKGQDLGDRNLRYAGTISYHPGVTIMTFSGISTKIGKAMKLKEDPAYETCAYLDSACKYLSYELFVAKLPLVIISGILFALSIFFLSEIFSLKSILPWILVVLFEPLLLSSSKLLHLDFLFAMFSIAGVSALLHSAKKNKKWAALLGGGFLGFALLTRFSGVFVIPGILASFFYLVSVKDINFRDSIKILALFALGIAIVFVGFYPPMWVAPIATLTYIVKSSVEISDNLAGIAPQYIRYFNNLSWYISESVKTLSLLLMLELLGGIFGMFVPHNKEKHFSYSVLIIYLSYFAFVNLADKQYIRYLVPVLIGIALPAGIGFYNLISVIGKRIGITAHVLK